MRPAQSLGVVTGIITGVLGLTLTLTTSCGEGNPGFDPPADEFVFPSGLMLDPRIPKDEPARWLFVVNANSDRRYNAASMVALDLDEYWAQAFADPSKVLPAGAALSDPDCTGDECRWCRRAANLPQVVECDEQHFIAEDATIHFGSFAGPAAAWDKDPADDEAMLLVPVRGEPSITYVELSGGLDGGDPTLECGQASDTDGHRKCDDFHRLRFLRNDPDANRLAREPFRVLVSPQPDLPLAYISHQGAADLTLMALDGLDVGGDGRPAIVHQAEIMTYTPNPAALSVQGGFGLAQRPCDVESGNAPDSTLGCTRPLVYSAVRWMTALQAFTAVDHQPLPDTDQKCVGPDELGTVGGIICEFQIERGDRIDLTGLSTAGVNISPSRPVLADIGFTRTGNELYVVQTNPGGLLRVDTSLGVDNDPLNVDVGQVEVCAQPTSFVIYDDGDNEYGIVTCYRSGEVFIVDLAALTVVGLSRAGIGPDAVIVDTAREVIYVGNSLDATISIIDMSRTRATRFTEIGRIGLQEPYTQ